MDREIISRKEALEKGLDRYFTGKECKYGHVSERYAKNKNCIECKKEDRKSHEYKEYQKEYQKSDKYKDKKRENRRVRYKNDPEYKILCICRSILHRTLNVTTQTKDSSTINMIGYTQLELKKHLENNFQPNMIWGNFGTEWHIDHKYPVSRYIKDNIEDPKIINALDNLLPMWAEHNTEKGDMTLEEYLEVRPDLREVYGNG